jgi:hypothetical protein
LIVFYPDKQSDSKAEVVNPDEALQTKKKSKKQQHRKDKPWDNDSIDHWKIEAVTPEEPLMAPVEVLSSVLGILLAPFFLILSPLPGKFVCDALPQVP